ncbi:hypothetical protein FRC19_009421 [Serendipita sp. 401]|nr:hypothetical protein FRC19_009421 [Serendipita sp. 401]
MHPSCMPLSANTKMLCYAANIFDIVMVLSIPWACEPLQGNYHWTLEEMNLFSMMRLKFFSFTVITSLSCLLLSAVHLFRSCFAAFYYLLLGLPHLMYASLCYLATAVNRHYHCCSASSDSSLVAFGSNKFIALWNLVDDKGIVEIITGHAGNITCLKFVSGEQNFLIAGDDQGNLYLHRKCTEGWQLACSVKAHPHAISTLVEWDGLVVTGSSDSTLKFWGMPLKDASTAQNGQTDNSFNLTQELKTGKRFPLSMAIASLPDSSEPLLAVGLTDTRIRLYVRQGKQFVEAVSLSGHEDWVKALAFNTANSVVGQTSLMLSSGSQDGTIRLWEILPVAGREEKSTKALEDQLLDDFEASLGELAGDEAGRQISTKQHLFRVSTNESVRQYQVTFDALLIGHDAGVTDIAWKPSGCDHVLLSSSVDSSVILWSPSSIGPNKESQIWTNHHRFGDVGGQRLGGFVGALWVNEHEIIAWGWNGGTRRWGFIDDQWSELQAVTGHASPVHGIDWEPSGRYLVSASIDQTVRIHGPHGPKWLELARPQTHGYDCIQAAFLSDLRFASISDEKVTRVFDAPGAFVQLTNGLGIRVDEDDGQNRPMVANVPPLGLSNKAMIDDVDQQVNPSLSRPPFEAELAATTLWPEIEKIFGHGYESISLSVSRSKTLIATSCKATTAKHAVVRLYDAQTFKPFGSPLHGHTLTVTKTAFNKDDRLILAVGKDRTWHLFGRHDSQNEYEPIVACKAHARVVWDCSWMHEVDIFATASRDKTVKVWDASGDPTKMQKPIATIKLEQGATAVDFRPADDSGMVLMAIGLENGDILIYAGSLGSSHDWSLHLKLPPSLAHSDHVRSVRWRPERNLLQLASCSDDHSVRILELKQ